MIVVPVAFAAVRSADGGDVGRQWVAALPALVERLCQQWGLEVEDPAPMHGYFGLVVPVKRRGERCALKISWQEDVTADEAIALATWDGRGAARLLAANPEAGALLLERLDWRRSLRHLELLEAAAVAGGLVRRLAVAAPPGIRTLHDVADDLAASLPSRQEKLGRPVSKRWLDAACDLARELGPHVSDRLVHGDLHYGNVLAGQREPWLAVDPKAVAGDPEFSVPELLWTRIDEVSDASGVRRLLAVLVESGALRADIACGWAILRCVDYWLWGLANGLTNDPVRCQRVLEAIA